MVSSVLRNVSLPFPQLGRLGGDLRKDPNEGWHDWVYTAGSSVLAIFSLVWVAIFGVAALFDFDYAVHARGFITEYTISGTYFPLLEGEVLLAPFITWLSIVLVIPLLLGKFRLLAQGMDLPERKRNLLHDSGTILIYHLISVIFYNMMIEDVEMYLLPAIVMGVTFFALMTFIDVMKSR